VTHATDQHIGPTGATHGAPVPGRAAPDPRFGQGPYETGGSAVIDTRGVFIAAQASADRDLASKILEGLVLGSAREAGVELGAYDRRMIAWFATWEPEVVQVILGLIERAHIGGRRAAAAEATGLRALLYRSAAYIVPCPPPDVAAGVGTTCAHGASWPCSKTELAWEIRGLDVEAERGRACAQWRHQMAVLDAVNEPGFDTDLRQDGA
jgi:hypothetical protein